MAGAGRQASGGAGSGRFSRTCSAGRRGSPLPDRFGRTKPTVDFGRTKPTADPLDGTTACAPSAPDQGPAAGQSATRCPASLGQRKSFRCKALGRAVPVSRGCGMGTPRQCCRRACVITLSVTTCPPARHRGGNALGGLAPCAIPYPIPTIRCHTQSARYRERRRRTTP
jgi:hypothetical protein